MSRSLGTLASSDTLNRRSIPNTRLIRPIIRVSLGLKVSIFRKTSLVYTFLSVLRAFKESAGSYRLYKFATFLTILRSSSLSASNYAYNRQPVSLLVYTKSCHSRKKYATTWLFPLSRRSIEARRAVIVESRGIQNMFAHLIRGSKNFYFKVSTPIIVSV